MATMMKAAVIRRAGGPEVLQIESVPVPVPKTGEARARARVRRRLRRIHVSSGVPGAGDPDVAPLGDLGRHAGDAPDRVGFALSCAATPARRAAAHPGGTTSVGLAAAAIAKGHGAIVWATTRRADGEKLLRDSRDGAVVCMMGIMGNERSLDAFNPMEFIPTAVCLTAYSGGSDDFLRTPLEELAQQIARGALRVPVGRVFRLDEIVEAHRCMEENRASGKVVVLT